MTYRRTFCVELHSTIYLYYTPIKQWGQGRDSTFSLGLNPHLFAWILRGNEAGSLMCNWTLFLFLYLLGLRIPHHWSPRTCSTTSPHIASLSTPSMKWAVTCALNLKTSRTMIFYGGGLITIASIHTCFGWPSTITPYPVSVAFFIPTCTHLFIFFCFLTTTGSSVGVKHAFSQGHLLLPHMHNCLSSESTCAFLCLGDWSAQGLVKDCDIKTVVVLPDILGEQEPEFQQGWEKARWTAHRCIDLL
jgi:hypothetical protein